MHHAWMPAISPVLKAVVHRPGQEHPGDVQRRRLHGRRNKMCRRRDAGGGMTETGRIWEQRLLTELGQLGACGVEVLFGAPTLGVTCLGEGAGPFFEELAEFFSLAGGVGAEPVQCSGGRITPVSVIRSTNRSTGGAG
jgi:hypothetical protein